MATTKKKPVTIAKTGAKKPAKARKPATKRKPAAKKPVAKKLTPAEERDQKAKATVKELLKDSPITTPPQDDLLILDESDKEPKGVEWLEEQVTLQSTEIERLRVELATEKQNNVTLQEQVAKGGGVSDSELQKNVTTIFNELQTNYLKMGRNQQTNQPNLVIPPAAFMNRLIMFFPFLKGLKRF